MSHYLHPCEKVYVDGLAWMVLVLFFTYCVMWLFWNTLQVLPSLPFQQQCCKNLNIGNTMKEQKYLLMFDKPASLNNLSTLVRKMASKKEHVSGLHLECKSHEQQGVYAQCWKRSEGGRRIQLRNFGKNLSVLVSFHTGDANHLHLLLEAYGSN